MTDRPRPSVHVSAPEAFVDETTDAIARAIRASIEARGACRIALAGGGTPQPIYAALARRGDIDWTAVEFFFGDERAVGPSDPASNYRMAHDALLGPIDAQEGQVFRILGEQEPEAAATDYEARLGSAPLDLVLLGMGGDGHTASLFPGDAGLDVTDRRVTVATSPVEPRTRISLTFRAIDEARLAILLVRGASKAARLAQVWAEIDSGSPTLPAARITPGVLRWHVDAPAATALPKKDDQ
jgi:6-phosphogluconolactonase